MNTQPQKTIRILLVEDEPLWQEAIQQLLAEDTRLEVAGTASDYPQAITLYQTLEPQIVLLDWRITGERDGLAVGQELLRLGLPPERIILISGSPTSAIPPHPFLYVPKPRIADELLSLIASLCFH